MKLCHSVGSLTTLPRASLSLSHWPLDSFSSQLRVYITCIWGRDTTLEPFSLSLTRDQLSEVISTRLSSGLASL